jgi:parallel beta-helix repeat protein
LPLPRPRPLALLLAALPLLLSACTGQTQFPGYVQIAILAVDPSDPRPLEFRAREALLAAKPGTIIEFPEGSWAFTDELTIDVSHITLRGQGADRTTLDFTGQQTGAQGILATGDAFAMQNIRVLNPKGDGVRVEGVDGVIFEKVHVEWSGEPKKENGAYGLYPVQSRNILIDGCFVRGASDAGLYVGQSENIVVRRSRAEGNVAGIEIENSKDADVYLNVATDNTGGILVFDLPGLQRRGCRADVDGDDEPDCKGTRVFANWIYDNNRANFANGGTVALVPPGSGFILLSTDTVEVFGNVIRDHATANIALVSYELLAFAGLGYNDPNFDPWPERIDIRSNEIDEGGWAPQGDLGIIANIAFNAFGGIPDIFYDGFLDPAKTGGDGHLQPSVQICIGDDNVDGAGGMASYGSLDAFSYPPDFDRTPHQCVHPARQQTELSAFSEAPDVEDPYTPEEIEALCQPGVPASAGVNWGAFVVDCPRVADYRLFQDPSDPTAAPNAGGTPFDLTTPLFSDYAQKYRFVFLPPDTSATYSESDVFDFPVGTIIVKSFAFAADLRDLSLGEDLVETRLLMRRPEGWHGIAYIWNQAESEAAAAPGGGQQHVAWLDGDGLPRETDYQIPSTSQCNRCHFGDDGAVPIGPKARLLNRSFDYGGGMVQNQLTHWSEAEILTGAPLDPADAPRLPFWNDPGDGTLELRARAYLESNCAHCHNPEGRARFSGLFLEHDRALGLPYGLCKTPVAAGTGAGGLAFDLVPGDPLASIMIFRMADNDRNAPGDQVLPQIKMPELSKSVVHEEGVALVSDWIEDLPGSCP